MKIHGALLVVGLIGLAGWLCWRERAAPANDSAKEHGQPVERSATAALTANAERPPSSSERTPVMPSEAAPVRALATLRGRCLDPSAQPLTGVTASLRSQVANQMRMDAWSKSNDVPVPVELEVTTGADGVFAFSFWPPPPLTFNLALHKPGFAGKHGRWNELAPGETQDVGDVVLQPGTRLRGRLVDSSGEAIANAHINVVRTSPAAASAGLLHAAGGMACRSGNDGSFESLGSLGAGEYRLHVSERVVQEPKTLTLEGGEEVRVVDIVVAKRDEGAALAGIVVDDQGQPIRGVDVSATDLSTGSTTDRDGRFRLLRSKQGKADRVRVTLLGAGHEPMTTSAAYAWGQHQDPVGTP